MAIDETLRAQGYCAYIKPAAALARRPRQHAVCHLTAGHGTDHKGEGCCARHGGNAGTVKSGLYRRYATITNPTLRALLDDQELDPDPLNLEPEVKLVRSLVIDYANRYMELTEALLEWHRSWLTADHQVAAKPRQIVDIISVGKLIDTIGALAERIHKQRAEGMLTLAGVDELLGRYAAGVLGALQETVTDDSARAEIFRAVDRRTAGLTVRTGSRPGPV